MMKREIYIGVPKEKNCSVPQKEYDNAAVNSIVNTKVCSVSEESGQI